MNKQKDKHHSGDVSLKSQREPLQTEKQPEAAAAATPAEQAAQASAKSSEPQKSAQEIERLKDQLLRLGADFENYRKRSLREKNEIYENANETLTLELLPALDHLQLALSAAGKHEADKAFREGLQLIADQLMTVLVKFGLEKINSEKQQFDPNLHEAVSCLPSETEPEGVIIAQSRPGYKFKNRLLRPAQVVVSGGKPLPKTNDKQSSAGDKKQ
ncbi:MAG: nucleotide exchange factor GrpE [Kiritimatiellae bacterium]|nr:nucleotide exchange factor GrpE [Kiritimatiellia bacterium]